MATDNRCGILYCAVRAHFHFHVPVHAHEPAHEREHDHDYEHQHENEHERKKEHEHLIQFIYGNNFVAIFSVS
jgi:ABC-type Zn2+ transport system substrate-binding protein/surface adhesin